jgi:hypothetical protein
MEYGELDGSEEGRERPPDATQERAEGELETFFDQRRGAVFYSRQVEVLHEGTYFHWITNRALQVLEERRAIFSERRLLITGGQIKILWHRSFRYYRRAANRLVELVNEYSVPNMGGQLWVFRGKLWR